MGRKKTQETEIFEANYDEYIEKEFVYDDMTSKQIKYDKEFQSIISDSCRTAYQMTDRLKKQFYKSGESLLNLLISKQTEYKSNNNQNKPNNSRNRNNINIKSNTVSYVKKDDYIREEYYYNPFNKNNKNKNKKYSSDTNNDYINFTDRLQIINKDINIIGNIYSNDENLFTFNTILNIKNIKVFGYKHFFNNHKTNKFENNSKHDIFLGYPENFSNY
ncbi:hypothetical protein U3516DRAFT_736712 [Neocallimastix sp. 'constans']